MAIGPDRMLAVAAREEAMRLQVRVAVEGRANQEIVARVNALTITPVIVKNTVWKVAPVIVQKAVRTVVQRTAREKTLAIVKAAMRAVSRGAASEPTPDEVVLVVVQEIALIVTLEAAVREAAVREVAVQGVVRQIRKTALLETEVVIVPRAVNR